MQFAKVSAREKIFSGPFAKVSARKMQKFRQFFSSRKFLLAKLSAPKVILLIFVKEILKIL